MIKQFKMDKIYRNCNWPSTPQEEIPESSIYMGNTVGFDAYNELSDLNYPSCECPESDDTLVGDDDYGSEYGDYGYYGE